MKAIGQTIICVGVPVAVLIIMFLNAWMRWSYMDWILYTVIMAGIIVAGAVFSWHASRQL